MQNLVASQGGGGFNRACWPEAELGGKIGTDAQHISRHETGEQGRNRAAPPRNFRLASLAARGRGA